MRWRSTWRKSVPGKDGYRYPTQVILGAYDNTWSPIPFRFLDRTTGDLYGFTHDSEEDLPAIAELTANQYPSTHIREPIFYATGVAMRLYLNDGAFALEDPDFPAGVYVEEEQVFTWKSTERRTTYSVYADETSLETSTLGLKKWTGLGTDDLTVTDLGLFWNLNGPLSVFGEDVFEAGIFV